MALKLHKVPVVLLWIIFVLTVKRKCFQLIYRVKGEIKMIEQILEQLAEIRAQIDLLNVDKKTAIDSIITDEQRAAIRDIEFEFGEKLESAQANASELESKVKALVVEHGATVKSSRLQAVYAKGRIVWDTKAMDGYAINHPELYAFRNEGEPSVSIRVVK